TNAKPEIQIPTQSQVLLQQSPACHHVNPMIDLLSSFALSSLTRLLLVLVAVYVNVDVGIHIHTTIRTGTYTQNVQLASSLASRVVPRFQSRVIEDFPGRRLHRSLQPPPSISSLSSRPKLARRLPAPYKSSIILPFWR